MKLAGLKNHLSRQPDAHVRFLLPLGEFVPAHAHATEVARIDKKFVDCGGTLHNDVFGRRQTWFADDTGHRLTAGRLFKILDKAKSFPASDDLEVDVEHEAGFISQFPLESVEVSPVETVFYPGTRHTACLAMDKCLPPAKSASEFDLLKFNSHGQSGSAGCCTTKPQPK